MPDISMCSPTKLLKKCDKCYRLKAKPDRWQSYSDFYDACKKGKYEYFYKITFDNVLEANQPDWYKKIKKA